MTDQLSSEQKRIAELEAIIREFTPAARDILWCALCWNDHNFDYKALLDKANRAAAALGCPRIAKDWWKNEPDGVEKVNAWMARIDRAMGASVT